jgi:outer membrane protein assembly factor BamD (BamD/ComL family)
LINLIFKHYKWNEKDKFIDEIEKYLNDFPIIGLNIKRYKTKAPQFFPARSKFFDEQIISILGKLEDGNYTESLKYFEIGIKNFIKAKSKTDLKKVIDDMHASIDEFIKVFTNDNNKSFRSIFKSSDEYKKYGFKNKHQKEMFKNLKDMMDAIKHGSNKNFDKDDIEIIINGTASLLSFLTEKKYKNKI